MKIKEKILKIPHKYNKVGADPLFFQYSIVLIKEVFWNGLVGNNEMKTGKIGNQHPVYLGTIEWWGAFTVVLMLARN